MSSVSAPVGPLGPRGQQGGATRPLAPEPPLGLHPAGHHFRSLPAVPQAGAVLCGGGGGRCVLPARPGAWGMPHPSGGCQAFPRPTLPRAQPRSRPRPRDRGPEPGGGARLGGRDIENFHKEQIWSLSPFLAPGSSNSWNVLSAESGKCVFCYVNEVTRAGHQENQSGD